MYGKYCVAFFGHRNIEMENVRKVEECLEELIEKLIKEKAYVEFLVGRNGDFDQCVSSTVRRTRKRCGEENSDLILELPYLSAEYSRNEEFFYNYYTLVEVPYAASRAHPKAAIPIRNREMAERADLVICYIKRESGGAWKAVEYAKKQNKRVINVADMIRQGKEKS